MSDYIITVDKTKESGEIKDVLIRNSTAEIIDGSLIISTNFKPIRRILIYAPGRWLECREEGVKID